MDLDQPARGRAGSNQQSPRLINFLKKELEDARKETKEERNAKARNENKNKT
jgi:hypothetical protein